MGDEMLDDFKENIVAATITEPLSAESDDLNRDAIPSSERSIAAFALSLQPSWTTISPGQVHLAVLPQAAPTIYWDVNASGNWSTTTDWSLNRLPDSSDNVLISTRNSQTITFSSGTSTIHSLAVGDDSFVMSGGSLTITDGASFSREFSIGAATLTTGGTTTIPDQNDFPAVQLQNSADWKNTGTINDGGVVSFSGASIIDNEKKAVFNLTTDDAGMNGSGNTVENAGTLAKTGGAGTSIVAEVLDNTGTVSASSGTLDFTAGGSLGGTFSTSNDAAIELGGGSFATVSTSAKLGGDILVTGGALSPATGNTMTLSGTDTFGGANGAATLAGAGTVASSGTTTIVDHSGFTSTQLNGAMWQITGKVYDGGLVSLSDASTIDNLAGGVFSLTTNDGAMSGGSSNTFDNAGTLAKAGGAGASIVAVVLDNTGTVSASSGDLDFTDGGSLGGTFATSNAGTIELGGGTFGTVSSAVTLGGNILVSGATISPATDNTMTLAGTDTFGGTNGAATLAGAGTTATSGATTVVDHSDFTSAQLNGATWQNSGTVTDAGLISLANASTVDNLAEGTFNLTTDDADISGGSGNTFDNVGTLAKVGGGGTSAVAAALNNTGTVSASSGNLDFTDGGSLGGTFATSNSGTIELGGGTFGTVTSTVTLGGNVLVSGASLSPATDNTMTLSGTDTFGGTNGAATLGGAGIVATSGTTTVSDQTDFTSAQLNGATWQNSGTVSDAGLISLSNASTIDNLSAGVFNLTTDDAAIGGGSGNTFDNVGTLAKTGGSGTSTVAAALDNTGTVSAASGILDFTDGGSLGGTFATSNSGAIELGGGTFGTISSAVTLGGNILVSGGTLSPTTGNTMKLSGTDAFGSSNGEANLGGAGTVATSGATTVSDQTDFTAAQLNGATWQNSGTVTDAGLISLSNASIIDNLAAGIFNLTTNDAVIGGGSGNIFDNTGTVSASSGILEFTDGGSLGGTFATSNAAAIELGGGTFGTVSSTVNLGGNILISGAELSPATGNTLTLSGTDTFGGSSGEAAFGGDGIVATSGTTTVSDQTDFTAAQLTGATWQNSGTVNDGGLISLSNAAIIDNAASKDFNLTTDDAAIGGGSGNTFNNAGTFAKIGGVGFSNVDATFDNTGTINASSGTIDFHDAVGGTGTAQVDAYAGLEFDSSATSSLTMVFNGGNATLDLLNPSSFAAVISGFATSDTIDLLGITATKAALKSGDALLITDGTTTVATLQLSGSYSGDSFSVKSDGNGGTDIATNAPAAPVITIETAGSFDVYLEQSGQTIASTGENTNISILAGTSHDTFRFDGAFGHVAIAGFVPGANTLVFDHNDFANAAALEAHAVQNAEGDTVISLDAHDTIVLRDVSLAAFDSHASDWHFV